MTSTVPSSESLESQRGPFEVVRDDDLAMTTRDGVVLRADVYRPKTLGPYPVLVRRTPYGKRSNDLAADFSEAHYFASHGYLVVVQDTRGRFTDGWYRSGDLGVLHPDGYIELRDRSKDVIISGGENITSVEVEQVIASHPAVLEVAVVGAPDDRWGEVPVAYVVLRPGGTVSEAELIDHVKARLARFKAPKRVTFGELPHTSTGKIQKVQLREREWAGRQHHIA